MEIKSAIKELTHGICLRRQTHILMEAGQHKTFHDRENDRLELTDCLTVEQMASTQSENLRRSLECK